MIAELNKGPIPSSNPFEFKRVDGHSTYYPIIKDIFENQLTTVYGDQTEFLTKIQRQDNRRCEVVLSENKPVGFLVWKRQLENDEFIVPNLHIINPKQTSVNEIGKALVETALKYAQNYSAKKVRVTLPASDVELMQVLTNKDFRIIETRTSKSTGLAKHILNHTLARNNALSSTNADVNEASHKIIKKRGRNEDDVSASEHSRIDDTREDSVRKRAALGSNNADRPRDFDREKREFVPLRNLQSSSAQSYSSRSGEESRRGIPISNPSSRQGSLIGRPSNEPYGRQDDYQRTLNYAPQTRPATSIVDSAYPNSRHHSATLMKKYIHQIKSGGKTIEGRVNSGMFLNFKEGDTVRFFYMANTSDDVTCRIVKVAKFSSFTEMLEKEGFRKCLTDVNALEDAIRIYNDIPGYREKASRFGVLALHIKVVK